MGLHGPAWAHDGSAHATGLSLAPWHADIQLCSHPFTGEKYGKSLLGKDEPAVWYQAAAALPALPPCEQVSDEVVDQLRGQCEQLLEAESAAFAKDMQRRNMADYKWLQQVKQSGTTADKVAAVTLQVQVRACTI